MDQIVENVLQRTCPVCGAPSRQSGAYCLKHHAEYVRRWRILHLPSEPQRAAANARSYVKTYLKRGKIVRYQCLMARFFDGGCMHLKAQAHHFDYNKPLEVIWLCEEHHQLVTTGEIIFEIDGIDMPGTPILNLRNQDKQDKRKVTGRRRFYLSKLSVPDQESHVEMLEQNQYKKSPFEI